MSAFIKETLKYPPQAIEHKVEGTVVLRIAIDYRGRVTGSKIKSSLGRGCDEEAQRIVELMQFEVEQKVRKGRILFHKTINITFRLPKPKKKAEPTTSTQLTYNVIASKPSAAKPTQGGGYSYTISY